MTSDEKLIKATCLLGLIPLTVGLSIFLSWWVGKAWFLTTLHKLEHWGFIWTLISIPLGLAGLFTGLIYLSKTSDKDRKKGLFGLFCVFVNIPVLIWILNTQGDIEKRAYVRVYNKTDSDLKSLAIANSLFTESFKSLANNDHRTGYFYPNYDEFDSDAPQIEEVILTIQTNKEEKRIILPAIYKGECLQIFIDRNFKVEVKGRWYD
jgi:hypothetical protein